MKGVAAARDLFGPGQSTAIRDLLQSLFAMEVLRPSRCIWLLFGWISDIEIIDNRARQFAAIRPDWPATGIRLVEVLEALLERGGSVALVMRDVEHNRRFFERTASLRARYPRSFSSGLFAEVHDKGLLGDDYLVSGSMNLTYNGITVNDEHITLRTDRASIEEWRLVLERKWRDRLS